MVLPAGWRGCRREPCFQTIAFISNLIQISKLFAVCSPLAGIPEKYFRLLFVTYVFNTYVCVMNLFRKDTAGETGPTKTEMDVLKILWEFGPSTVRSVHDKLNEQREVAVYTSTLKLMQVMKEKGMLNRDESQMKHVYSAAVKEEDVKGSLLGKFVDSMYHGSPSELMVALLGNDKTSVEELKKIKELLKNLD
jgi:BlaI family penicillinase repressor